MLQSGSSEDMSTRVCLWVCVRGKEREDVRRLPQSTENTYGAEWPIKQYKQQQLKALYEADALTCHKTVRTQKLMAPQTQELTG